MRKTKIITVTAEGRDKGKSFLLVEKSAWDTERWATRALLALSRAGADIPEEALGAGALGILIAGLDGVRKLPFHDADALMGEMLACIAFVPDVGHKDPMNPDRPFTRALTLPSEHEDGDIEEVATLMQLRGAILELHLGFSPAAILSDLAATIQSSNLPDTSTSRKPAARSSRRAKPA